MPADSDPAGFRAQRSECKDEGEQVGVAYAAQLYGSAASSHYSKLGPSTPAVKGYVAVWVSGLSNGTGGAGHVAIVLADQGGSLQILTQNSGATHIGSMSKAYLTGLLRPKNLTPPSNNPIGSIDEVASPRAGVVRIRGWAPDRDDAGASIQVHAHVGGQAGAPNTEEHPVVLNSAGPEVNSTIGVPGNPRLRRDLRREQIGKRAGVSVRDQCRRRRQCSSRLSHGQHR